MNMPRAAYSQWVGLIIAFYSAGALSADACNLPEKPNSEILWRFLGEQNLCAEQFAEAESKRFRIDYVPLDVQVRKQYAARTWNEIVHSLEAQCPSAGANLMAMCERVLRRAQLALDTINSSVYPNANAFAKQSAWKLVDGKLAAIEGPPLDDTIPIKDELMEACRGDEGSTCPETYRKGMDLLKAIYLGAAAATYYSNPIITELAADAARANREWNDYIFESKPMYPWELIFTDYVITHCSFCGNTVKTEKGLRLPPDYQYFLFHPAPGFEYLGSADDGQQLSPAIYIEILGINKWRERGFSGISIVASYADRAGLQDVRSGILLTYASKYSFAITYGDGEAGVVVGLDIANWYTANLKPTVDKVRN